MSEEEKKTQLGDLYEKLNKAQQANHHQSVLDHTEKSKLPNQLSSQQFSKESFINIKGLNILTHNFIVLQLDGGQEVAIRSRLTSLIRLKHFDQAVELVKGKEKQYSFEFAYVLHRQGKNKEALDVLKSAGDMDSHHVKHLISQVVSSILFYHNM